MKLIRTALFVLLSTPVSLFAQDAAKPAAPTACQAPTKVHTAEFLTDAANLMAGFDTRGPLAELAKTPASANHRSAFSASWQKLDARQLDRVKAFSEQNIVALSGDAPLFYPFSGPDFLYAYALFPKASSYLLTGLEPVGSVPELDKFKADELAGSLAELRKSLYAILNFSFFKTNDMRGDFRRSRLQGVVPVLMTFAAKSGFDIFEVNFFILGTDGKRCLTDAANLSKVQAGEIPGVELMIQQGSAGIKRRLVYLSSDIGDGGLAKTPQYANLVRTLKPGATFIKSASFLMHKNYFSSIRNLIMEVSPLVLQDDSGIPYSSFELSKWQPTFYGNYLKPIPLFANFNQPNLTAAFAKYGSTPLTFSIGYRHNKGDSSLILMKKSTVGTAPVSTAR